jgi:hypothetical protein
VRSQQTSFCCKKTVSTFDPACISRPCWQLTTVSISNIHLLWQQRVLDGLPTLRPVLSALLHLCAAAMFQWVSWLLTCPSAPTQYTRQQ